ncbi:MAG: DUF4403 family protein [Sphingomonadales bacterium]|nr:DUF4403 family protein [Sphingomonadales bacterium]
MLGAVAALLLGSCGTQSADPGAPPKASDEPKMEPQSSVIAVPIAASLNTLDAALEREIPRQLWTIDKPDQTCAAPKQVKVLIVKIKTPRIKCRLVGEVTRGPLQISGSGQTFVVTMPIRAVMRAKDVGGILNETATANARVRAVVRLNLASDWSLRGKVDIAYDWTREPGIDILGQRVEFTSKADAKLRGVVGKLEQTLSREISQVTFRPQIARAWRQAFTALRLNKDNPTVWMRITPQELHYGGYQVAGRRLVLNLGMKAITETFIGERPEDPASTPLPPVKPLKQNAGAMEFYIPVVADYAQLEPVILEALTKRSAQPFDVPGFGAVRAQFEKVVMYGTDGGRIAVGLTFTATALDNPDKVSNGTIWLTGLPLNPANTQQVNFTDIRVSGLTDDKGANLLLKLANAPGLSQTIADALGQNFTKDYNSLMEKIGRAIDEQREGRMLIRARIDNVRTGSLAASGRGLYLQVWGTGTASIQLLGT